jgi:hypothetical protein
MLEGDALPGLPGGDIELVNGGRTVVVRDRDEPLRAAQVERSEVNR